MTNWTPDQNQKKWLLFALVTSLIGLGFHAYLTSTFYDANFSMGSGESLCNINSTFNCTSVSTSKYAALFGIPMALWGAVVHAALALLLATRLLNFSDHQAELGRSTFYFASFILLVSLAMGGISLSMLGVYCAFCMVTYVTSILQFFFILKASPDKSSPPIGQLFGQLKWIPIITIALPVGAAVLTHNMILDSAGIRDYREAIDDAISNWQRAKSYTFNTEAGLTLGSSNAKMTIVEFADFLCPHCKFASTPIKSFVKENPDVKLVFKTFPLDGCRGSGIRCNLARATYCANLQKKGWEVHDWIFDNQEKWPSMGFTSGVEQMAKKYDFNKDELMKCIESEDTKNAVNEIRKEGENSGLRGTPTVYVNGRKVQANSKLIKHVLKKVYQEL